MSSGRRSMHSPPEGCGGSPSKDPGKQKVPELDVIGGKLSARGQLHKVMEEVCGLLSEKNLDAFRASCFGHLLDMPTIQPQMQLIFLMLNSLEVGSESRNVLSFVINDRIVEFGPKEFFCVSGLSFRETVALPTSSYMHGHIFGGRSDLKAKDILAALQHYSRKHKGGGSHVLKLALLHVLYGLLLNRDKKWKNIEVDFMHLVDDVEVFNRYPWGRVAYDFLVHWTHRARANIDRLTAASDRPSTDVCGFYLTIQIFAFEIMPMLARHCAIRIDAVAFPRMRRWTADSFFKYTILLEFFRSSDPECMMQFELSDEERGRLIAAGFSEGEGMKGQSEVHPSQSKKSIGYELVDEDDDHGGDGVPADKGVYEMGEHGKSKENDSLDDGGKGNGSDDVVEVKGGKGNESYASRRIRRERAAYLGSMLKAKAVHASASGAPEAANEVSLEKLADIMLDMKVRMQADSDCIFKLSDMIKGMNSLLENVLERLSAVESSVLELKRSNERVGSIGGEAVDSLPREQPSDDVADKSGGAKSFDPIQEGVFANVVVEGAKSMEKVSPKTGGEIDGSVGSHADNEESLEGEKKGQEVDWEEAGVDEAKKYDADQGSGTVKGQVESLTEKDDVDPGVATDAGIDPLEEEGSSELVLSDIEAYEPDVAEEVQPSARKRLFQEEEDVGPSYGTICGEPLQKKRKGKGKKGSHSEKVKLPSLLWVRFVPHREYDFPVESGFFRWYTAAKNLNSKVPIKLPTQCLTEATWDWFTPLYTAKGWLVDDHIDVLMNLLIIYSRAFPKDFKDDWTLIESIGTQTLALEDMHNVSERILPYVEGDYPHQGGRPWHEVEFVYGICNIGENHWVLYRIELNEQRIVFFDSLSAKKSQWEDVKVVFATICINVSKLVELLDVYRSRNPRPVLKKVWQLLRYEHPPQQQNVSDCGVLAMKALECLVTGQPFSAIVPERAVSYRRGYCAELYATTMASRDV